MKRIGMLTSGGDCQALNAAMRGVVKTLANGKEEVEIYGFLDGYRGLIYGNFRMLTDKDFSGILTKGGTILGTSRTPFKTIQDPDPNGLNKVEAMKQNYYKLQLDCLVILGGNGTHTVVGSRVDLDDIHAGSRRNGLTNTAFPTGAVLCGVFAVHCFRKNLRHRSFTGTSRSGEQIRMADPVRP